MRSFAILIVMSLAVSGCKEPPPMIWADFCKPQNRKIPAEERYRDVLVHLLSKKADYEKRVFEEKHTKGLIQDEDTDVHLYKYYDHLKARHPKFSDSEIAAAYLKNYPECCSQQTPTYLREHWNLDAYVDGLPWAVDILVWQMLPPPPLRKPPPIKVPRIIVVAVDACDERMSTYGWRR